MTEKKNKKTKNKKRQTVKNPKQNNKTEIKTE